MLFSTRFLLFRFSHFFSTSSTTQTKIFFLIYRDTKIIVKGERKKKKVSENGANGLSERDVIPLHFNGSKLVDGIVNIKLDLPSNFPLLMRSELFDFLDEFRDIWLWLGLLSVLFFSITSWQLYDVCCCIVNMGWTLPWSPSMEHKGEY